MATDESYQPPFGVRLDESADELRVVCYWFSIWAVGTFVAAGFFIYVLIWLIDFLKQAGGGQLDQGTFGVLVAVICGLVYYGIASVVNRTTITITADEVRVRNGPLPWLGGGRGECRHVVDVDYRQRSERCERLGMVHRYYVDLIFRGGRHVSVLSGFYSGNAARFVHDLLREELVPEDAHATVGW